MQINSHYPRARGLVEKVGHPTGQTTIARPASRRPRGLASPAPWGFGFPVPWAVANPAERPQAAHSGNETASEKTQQPADARAFRLTPQSTAPKYLPAESVRNNASSEAEGIKGSTFFYILRTSTMPDFSTSRRGIRLILSMEGHSNARSSLGAHPPPARSNGLRNALGPYHFLSFPGPHNQPQPLGPQAVREVFGTSRARACAREAMRPFLNNGTTFTTCKPIAPQRPRPSEQSPKTPRIARAKLELGARSRSIGAATFDPPLPRARVRAGLSYADFAEAIKRGTRARARAD